MSADIYQNQVFHFLRTTVINPKNRPHTHTGMHTSGPLSHKKYFDLARMKNFPLPENGSQRKSLNASARKIPGSFGRVAVQFLSTFVCCRFEDDFACNSFVVYYQAPSMCEGLIWGFSMSDSVCGK
jgi:hypothetical protein